jgi:hypothetical protein
MKGRFDESQNKEDNNRGDCYYNGIYPAYNPSSDVLA